MNENEKENKGTGKAKAKDKGNGKDKDKDKENQEAGSRAKAVVAALTPWQGPEVGELAVALMEATRHFRARRCSWCSS